MKTKTKDYIGQVRHIYHVHVLENSVTNVYRVHALYWSGQFVYKRQEHA